MTKDELREYLKGLGLKKDYRAKWDTDNDERGVIRFLVRGKFDVVDGLVRGTEVVLSRGKTTVWTSRVSKAIKFCKDHSIRLRKLDRECYFVAPLSVLDDVLAFWGGKIRKVISEEQRVRSASNLQKARESRKTLSGEAVI